MKLIGRFPDPMPVEMAQRAKEMLRKVYRAGFFGELSRMQDGIKVWVPWEQSEMVVLPYSRISVPVVCQTQENGRLEGWICETDAIRAADHPYIAVTMRAAYLLCEYLFPGVYADLDLHDKKNQEAFIFLKRLLRAEDMDALLRHRMDDAAIWQACRSSGDKEPVNLYERIALAPEPSILANCLEEEEKEIDEEKVAHITHGEKMLELDRWFPCVQWQTELGLKIFMRFLSHSLMERFDFSKTPQKTVVRAARFLNGIRNGGRVEDLLALRLPRYVSQDLLAVDWETITELLASLSRLPVDQVRELTAHTVLQRGEIIRKTAQTFSSEPNTALAFAFFMFCLRRALMERFDFSKTPQKTVVRAALFLNGIRNGGKAEDLEALRLPYHVSQRFLAVDWETITVLLAFLSKLPVDQVRELTAHTVLQLGEIIRNTARALARKECYSMIEEDCRARGKDGWYFETGAWTREYEDFCKKMQNSAILQDTLYGPGEGAWLVKTQKILRSWNEIGISVTKELYLDLRMHWDCREAYAKILSIEALARRQDGSWDRKILLDMLDELDDLRKVQGL